MSRLIANDLLQFTRNNFYLKFDFRIFLLFNYVQVETQSLQNAIKSLKI